MANALLAAGEAELTEKGVAGFSLRACAKRAGVSHGAPAHAFGNTQGLLTAIAQRGFEKLCDEMERRMAGRTGHDRLVGAGIGYVTFARANRAVFELMFGDRVSLGPTDADKPSPADRAFEILTNAVADAARARRGVPGDNWLDVAAAWSMVHGASHLLNAGRMSWMADEMAIEGLLVQRLGGPRGTQNRREPVGRPDDVSK